VGELGLTSGASTGRRWSVVVTDDLFLGGYALVRGGELVGVRVVDERGRRLAVFTIAGPDAERAESEYHRGATSVDLRLLKLQIRRLKDRGFAALRNEEAHDAGRYEGRRTYARR
jgi:hypothetical protein